MSEFIEVQGKLVDLEQVASVMKSSKSYEATCYFLLEISMQSGVVITLSYSSDDKQEREWVYEELKKRLVGEIR